MEFGGCNLLLIIRLLTQTGSVWQQHRCRLWDPYGNFFWNRGREKYRDLLLMIQCSGEAVVTVVCPGDAWRSLGMFLYKALKHIDEEEYIQVHSVALCHWSSCGMTGLFRYFRKTATCCRQHRTWGTMDGTLGTWYKCELEKEIKWLRFSNGTLLGGWGALFFYAESFLFLHCLYLNTLVD